METNNFCFICLKTELDKPEIAFFVDEDPNNSENEIIICEDCFDELYNPQLL